MKNRSWSLVTYGTLFAFFLYWILIFTCMTPSRVTRNFTTSQFPRFRSMFGFNWKLFTPPFTYNMRLYYVTRESNRPWITDTMEVLEPIAQSKRRNSPFNQEEYLIDQLLSNSVIHLQGALWRNRRKPNPAFPATLDPGYIANAIAKASKNPTYQRSLQSLKQYGQFLVKEKGLSTAGKEMKIMIRDRPIPPFKEGNKRATPIMETLVFETPYYLLAP